MGRILAHADKILLGVLALFVLGIPLLIAADACLDRFDGEAFARVRPNDDEAKVIALMGRPDVERPCARWAHRDLAYRDACATEARYEHFLSAWVIVYTDERRVLAKHRNVSE
jgi:hypothetical protein